jgi:membrane fusion protein, multidrug efflux system
MNKGTVFQVVFLTTTLFTAGCKEEAQILEPIRPVLSEVIEPSQQFGTSAAGIIEPRFKSELGFRVASRLVSRPVNVGDVVTEGQTIATVDSTALELAVRAARAELAKAQAKLVNASADENRKRRLIATEATSKQSLDTAEQVRAGAEATVAHAQANLTKAIEQFSYAQLKTEFAGVVTAVSADVGQVVSPSQKVVTVARPDVREAVVDIGPEFPEPLEIGLPFRVSLQLLPDVTASGQIREIAPQADPVTRTRRVRISLNDPPPSFRLGATITAKLIDGEHPALRVPASALLTRDGKNFVWLVDATSGTVSLNKVEVSPAEGGLLVTGGLTPGARIATVGVHTLKAGQKVRISEDSKP